MLNFLYSTSESFCTAQMAQSNQARRSEDGYQGSEEENTNIHNGISPEGQGEDEYYQSSLCKVEEEASSQDYSQEGGDEFSRNSIDRSDPNVAGAKESPPYDYQSELMNIKEVSREDSNQNQHSYDSNPEFYGDQQILSKQSDTPENSDGEGEGEGEGENGDLEYYFSCHERIIHDTYSGQSGSNASSDIFKNVNKDEFIENNTAPNLSRSTLQDQIDYDLINLKINESSVESALLQKNVSKATLYENKNT